MSGFVDFFKNIIVSFSGFGNWFINGDVLGIKPYLFFGLSFLIIVIGLHILKLVNPLS